MANPNIVSVTSIKGESVGFALTATTTTTLMTVAANKVIKINRITCANVDGTNAADLTLSITKSNFTPDGVDNLYIAHNGSTGAQTVQLKTATGTGTTWATTDKGHKIVYSDGTNIVDVFADFSEIGLSNQNPLKFKDADDSNFFALKAPATIGSSVTLTLPDADATSSGQALVSDGSGTLSFADAGITTGKAIAMAIVFG